MTTTMIATGVSRISVAQIEALDYWARQLKDAPHEQQLRIKLDLVEVDRVDDSPVQLLRARYGEQAVTIHPNGGVKPYPLDADV